MAKLTVLENEITILKVNDQDYISLTDMLKSKDGEFFISDWLRNRNTIEYLGIWEKIYNPDFNYGEFAIITSKVGLNSYKLSAKEWSEKTKAIALFGITAKQWRENNPKLDGNIRDYADVNQLAINQMKILNNDINKLGK